MPEFRLGKYQLLVEVARGGMGIVYVAAAQGPGGFSKVLILKELNPTLADDPSFLPMFLEEARLAARLDHPNIVQTLEVGQDGTRHYIAMEYLQGQTLAGVRRRRLPEFDLNAELRVACEVLQGLHYAHTLEDYDGSNLGIVHRDVSPQNVFLTYDGLVKVVDFGIAKAADSQLETKAGTIKGKVGYMAPEILRGSVDARADVYAVGVIIWEATAGRRLWKTKNEMEILTNLMRGEIPKLEEAKPEAPPELVRICAKAMAPDPEGRYPTAEALRVDLEAYLAQAGTVPTTRAIGTQMAAAFRAERDELRRVIEAQRSEIRQGIASRPQLPNVEPRPGEGHTPSHSSPRPLPNAGPLSISNPSVSTTGLNSERDAIAAPRNRKWLAGGSVAVVAAGVLAFTFWRSSPSAGSKEPTLVATPVEAQAAPAMPPAPPAPLNETTPSFAVVVRVAPGNATITMNGLRSSNPLATRCKRGETLHFVITANGFAPTTRDVACDTDLTLDLGLERVNGPMQAVLPLPRNVPTATVARTTAVAMTATPPPAARPPVAATDANPDGGAHPRHAIDPNSPYGTP